MASIFNLNENTNIVKFTFCCSSELSDLLGSLNRAIVNENQAFGLTMMQSPHDQFVKDHLKELLVPLGKAETLT